MVVLGLLFIARPGRWVPKPINPMRAEYLYGECQRIAENLTGRDGLTRRAGGNPKHKGLTLHTRNGAVAQPFGRLVDDGMLIGAVVNEDKDYASTIEGDWERMPGDTTCIFMGGDQRRFIAEVVWKTPAGTYAGQERPVVARFNGDPHGAQEDAAWDKPIEGTPTNVAAMHSAGDSAGVTVGGDSNSSDQAAVPPPSDPLQGAQVDAIFVPAGKEGKSLLEAFFGVRTEGNAPWFTCSQYTCCKPL